MTMQKWSKEVSFQRQDRTRSAVCLGRTPTPSLSRQSTPLPLPCFQRSGVVQADAVGIDLQLLRAPRIECILTTASPVLLPGSDSFPCCMADPKPSQCPSVPLTLTMTPQADLERVAEGDNVGVEYGCQHIALLPDVLPMVFLQDLLLAHHLHGVNVTSVLLAHLKHLQQLQRWVNRSFAAAVWWDPSVVAGTSA